MDHFSLGTLTIFRRACAALALALFAGACGDHDGTTPRNDAAVADARAVDDAATADAANLPPGLATFHDDAAAAVCGAMFRCCDGADQVAFFAPLRDNQLLTAFVDRLPPTVVLDEASCTEVLAEIYAITPFGDWVRAAGLGSVDFDAAALATCAATLASASCGAEARAALFDSTCFGFAPPSGGDVQRKIFTRAASVGTTCAPIRDGVGAAFYGTCDPDLGFCCYSSATTTGCGYPFNGDGEPRQGVCQAAAVAGAACSAAAPLQLCQTGLNCDADTARCVAPSTALLQVGDTCIDAGFNLLGECVGSYCDVLGTSKCEQAKPDGTSCNGPEECVNGACLGMPAVCAPNDFCTGTRASPADAGVAMIDAGMPTTAADAAPSGVGETCTNAIDLLSASVPSTSTGFTFHVAGGYGASNDYNPYKSASPPLPPSCSFVYDAAGQEVVYRVTLNPGDKLALRYAASPASAVPGIYLLDSCGATPTWPDYDASGGCGNNEYRSPGFCSLGLCDPVDFTFTYPTMLSGAPTVPRTFYVVLDQVGGANATGYQLEWKVTPA